MTRRILGIDPGVKCGWAILAVKEAKVIYTEYGLITLSEKDSCKRLMELYTQLKDLIVSWKPSEVITERGFYRHIMTTQTLTEFRAIAKLLAGQYNVPYHEYAPSSVKKQITGHGHAEKNRILHAVQQQLNISTEISTDTADALAIALTHLQKSSLVS